MRNISYLVLLFILSPFLTLSQNETFLDFQVDTFLFDGTDARIVIPNHKNVNKNWVWRARFWGHEGQTDLALLEQGFHIAYVDVAGLFGNREAVERWNKFYKFIIEQYDLNPKVAIEAMSRGGLIAYNWASENMDKVACIYADAPVCDIKSWPGGKFTGLGSEREWSNCLAAHKQDEESVLNYQFIPIYTSAAVAKAGIPVLHVCGNADTVVPFEENTQILASKYRELGGEIEIIIKEDIGHHPHSLKDPTPIVDFILKHTPAGSWRNLIDTSLSDWDIFMGAPHESSDLEGFEQFKDVTKGKPIGLNKDPQKVFSVIEKDGNNVIKITGEVFAGLVTKEDFENYHLKWKFKWGEKTWQPRIDLKRNSGVLYHSVGEYTDFWNVWMTSLECEVQETDCGDFITIGEGTVRAKTPATKEEGKYYFTPGADLVNMCWGGACPDGRTYKRGDPEKAHGEWNEMELLCIGNKSIHILNGVVVMVVIDPKTNISGEWVPMNRGKIQIQSEAAEVYYKDIEIRSIREFPDGIVVR